MLLRANGVCYSNYAINNFKLGLSLQNRDAHPQPTIRVLGAWLASESTSALPTFGDQCLAGSEPPLLQRMPSPHRQPHLLSLPPCFSILGPLWVRLRFWVWLSGAALIWLHFHWEGSVPGSAVEEERRRLNVYQTCFESLEFRQKVENRGESCVRVALR